MTNRPDTDDFIRSLARRPVPAAFRPVGTGLAMLAAGGLGLGLFLGVFGMRGDLGPALSAPVTLAKLVLPGGVAAMALWLALASARPGARLWLWPLLVPLAMALILVAGRLGQLAPGQIPAEVMGRSALACLLSIAALALAPTVLGLICLRRGATTRPLLSGALVGMAAGAMVAAGYALHCTEDSPLFYTLWYGLGIALSATGGAIAGQQLLRW
ncbi:NrsF family protein [Gemmobacter sp.]|uniref:NrsF family protein n=1 Tax=Gemmobacter sp. TaxID=1898957 RepID=UPI002AFF7FCF|nr:NrsF family protein [Gemmobacter sp.]